jgi:hypothetical protein
MGSILSRKEPSENPGAIQSQPTLGGVDRITSAPKCARETMQAETKATLERVVSKAATLRGSSFLAELERGGWKISFRDREIVVTRPPDEARDAFILNFRFFIVRNEPTSFGALAKLLDDPELSEQWKARFGELRAAVNDHLTTAYGQYQYGGRSLQVSNRESMDTFLYGGMVHANDAKAVARFREWSLHPGLIAMLELWFITTIKAMCMAIFLLSEMCEDELKRAS